MRSGHTDDKKRGINVEKEKQQELHAKTASKERDDQLAQKGTPVGEAVEANKEKKIKGDNFPAT
jgi:hypothetical protein